MATVQRWARGEQPKSVEMVRRVARYLDLPIRRLVIIAELFEPDELLEELVVPDPRLLSDERLITMFTEEMRRRFIKPDQGEPASPGSADKPSGRRRRGRS